MSKSLEALEKIRDCVAWCAYDGKQVGMYESSFNIIEEELKALEIIRETPEFAWYITIYKDAYEMVSDVKGFRVNNSVEELQKMFDLLKKVLSW